jgi:hypothetical protein
LIYILCFLYCGAVPISEHINANINTIDKSEFLKQVFSYRVNNKALFRERMVELLPMNLVPAYQYIINLEHDAKPDYHLIKLWMATSEENEKLAFDSRHVP